MDEKALVLVFKTAQNGKRELVVKDPDLDLTESMIKNTMNTIIERNIFETKTGDFVGIDKAYYIDSYVTECELD